MSINSGIKAKLKNPSAVGDSEELTSFQIFNPFAWIRDRVADAYSLSEKYYRAQAEHLKGDAKYWESEARNPGRSKLDKQLKQELADHFRKSGEAWESGAEQIHEARESGSAKIRAFLGDKKEATEVVKTEPLERPDLSTFEKAMEYANRKDKSTNSASVMPATAADRTPEGYPISGGLVFLECTLMGLSKKDIQKLVLERGGSVGSNLRDVNGNELPDGFCEEGTLEGLNYVLGQGRSPVKVHEELLTKAAQIIQSPGYSTVNSIASVHGGNDVKNPVKQSSLPKVPPSDLQMLNV